MIWYLAYPALLSSPLSFELFLSANATFDFFVFFFKIFQTFFFSYQFFLSNSFTRVAVSKLNYASWVYFRLIKLINCLKVCHKTFGQNFFAPNLFSNDHRLKIFHVKWSSNVIWTTKDGKVSCFLYTDFTIYRFTIFEGKFSSFFWSFKSFFDFWLFFVVFGDFFLMCDLFESLNVCESRYFVTCVSRSLGSEREETLIDESTLLYLSLFVALSVVWLLSNFKQNLLWIGN